MLKTLAYSDNKPHIVSGDKVVFIHADKFVRDQSMVTLEQKIDCDVTPIPTNHNYMHLRNYGARIVCGADRKLHIRVSPLEAA